MRELLLASGSPRRRELIALITNRFRVIVPEVDETIPRELTPEQAVAHLALKKARQVARAHPTQVVVGADTAVVAHGRILGKPRDEAEAEDMLRTLSSAEHRVVTGVALCEGQRELGFAQTTAVVFRELEDEEIRRYVATGEPMDKAGAYGIQGGGALFVEEIRGDYFNVVGLPVARLYQELKKFAVCG